MLHTLTIADSMKAMNNANDLVMYPSLSDYV